MIQASRDLVLSKMPCQVSGCGGMLWNRKLVEVDGRSVVRADVDFSTLSVGLMDLLSRPPLRFPGANLGIFGLQGER